MLGHIPTRYWPATCPLRIGRPSPDTRCLKVMPWLVLHIFATVVALLQSVSQSEPPTLSVDAASSAVYSAILDAGRTKPVLLQRETTPWPPQFPGCGVTFLATLSVGWQEAARDFQQKNGRVWLLPAPLPFKY